MAGLNNITAKDGSNTVINIGWVGNGSDSSTNQAKAYIDGIGQSLTDTTTDGNLSSITVGTTDPLANTSGAATTRWSIAALLRWLIREVRAITASTIVVRPQAAKLTFTPTINTSAYSNGQSLMSLVTVTNAVAAASAVSLLQNITVVDTSNQQAAITLIFFDRSVTLPSNGATWNVSNSDMAYCLGIVDIPSSYWLTFGTTAVVTLAGLNTALSANSGTSVYMAAVIRSSVTYAASALTVTLGVEY